MNAQLYPEELWIEAVKQILEHGHRVALCLTPFRR